MFWSTVEPVAMETVATMVQFVANRVLMSSDALSLTHCVKTMCLTHTHSCGVSFFFFFVIDCRSEFDITSAVSSRVFALCLMTSVHRTDITAQCCSALRDWSLEHDLYAACVCTSIFPVCSMLVLFGIVTYCNPTSAVGWCTVFTVVVA